MKKILLVIAISVVLFSCASKEEETTEGTTSPAGIQSVNGNIPDTTNSIDLSTQKQDTVQSKDSLKD